MRWLAVAALLLLNATLLDLLAAPPRVAPVRLERVLDEADLQPLSRAQAQVQTERRALQDLGRRMAGVLDAEQAAWLREHRDDVSLERFENPYWTELSERLGR